MLKVNELRKVSWRRASAAQSYDGYLVVADAFLRLLGREAATGIDASLAIPFSALGGVHEDADGTLVLDVADGVAILVRALEGELALAALTRSLAAASA